jgi:hypothetical protein
MGNETGREDSLQSINIQPRRPANSAPNATAEGKAATLEYYHKGDWEALESFCNITISSFIKDLPTPILSGSTVYAFHFGAIAYKNLGKDDKYLGCLKTLFSLDDYAENLNSEDQGLLNSDIEEYRALSKKFGPDRLNAIQVSEVLKKNGCFIATAVYGSPCAPEILVLQKFRDSYMLTNMPGKLFVKLYYLLSPPLASFIVNKYRLRQVVRAIIIVPLVRLADNLIKKEQ